MIASNDKVISIHYEVKDSSNNEKLDGNIGSKPLDFIFGRGQVIKGLEDSISGMKKGENKEFIVAPEDAYGLYNEAFLQDVPVDQFAGIELQVGMTLYGQSEDGSAIPVIVRNIGEELVQIDYNHPLAGKALNFYVNVIDIREATEGEKASGHIMCDDHMSGGCGSGCGCH